MMKGSCFLVLMALAGRVASAQQLPPEPTIDRAKTPFAWSNPTGLDVPDKLRFEQKWQGKAHCGINALYAMLRVKGKTVDLGDISTRLVLPESGASLEQIRELAARFGLDAQVIKTTPEQLRSLPMPLILHQAMSEKGKSDRDHFVLVVGLDTDGRYAVIDGTTGMLFYTQPAALESMWSGYALIADSGIRATGAGTALKVGLISMLGLIVGSQLYLVWLRSEYAKNLKVATL